MTIKQGLATGLIGLAPALTGCLSHTRTVPKARLADVVMSTSLEQMLRQISSRYQEIQTFSASVEMTSITGGNLVGKETQSLSFSGYILMRKPEFMRVVLLVPVVRSNAMDMVSDGQNFKLLVPSWHKAYEGNNQATAQSKNTLENLRPPVFFDSMFIQGPEGDELISMTTDLRLMESGNKVKKELIEEPAYAVQILAKPDGQSVRTLRVIHINSTDLLPYQQDIYDKNGQVVTKAYYSNYQYFGNIPFPMNIKIERPKDHYSLTVAVTKLTLNGHMDDDQFQLTIPEGIPIVMLK